MLLGLGTSYAQNIKIIDAHPGGGEDLMSLGRGRFSYCYRVQTFNPDDSKFRIYQFDSIPRLLATIELPLYGDYRLISHASSSAFTCVVLTDAAKTKLVFWFIDNQKRETSGSPMMINIAHKSNRIIPDRVVASKDNDTFFLVMQPTKKDIVRTLAVTPAPRVLWDTQYEVGKGFVMAAAYVAGKLITAVGEDGAIARYHVANSSDGQSIRDVDLSNEPVRIDRSFMRDSKIVLVGRPLEGKNQKTEKMGHGILETRTLSTEDWTLSAPSTVDDGYFQTNWIQWVDLLQTPTGEVLVGESFTTDIGAALGAAAALTLLAGPMATPQWTAVKFNDIVILPYSPAGPPRVVPLEPRKTRVPGLTGAMSSGASAVARGGNRYLGRDGTGRVRFLEEESVKAVSLDGSQEVLGKFNVKGELPDIIAISGSGLLVHTVTDDTHIVEFRQIPFEK